MSNNTTFHTNLKSIMINCSVDNGHHHLRALSTESRCVPCDPFGASIKKLCKLAGKSLGKNYKWENMSFKSAG